ncbi:MAG: hypothetical protein KatS3mg050_4823 [Litorilinea sp.]|nr:MAG: hypothetical protein KatS3mg050_4823 [Litorilinea sp.]
MMFGGGMLLGWLLPILLLVLGGMWLLNNSPSNRGGNPDGFHPPQRVERAEEILQERYARGEISREEYEEMRQTLKR